MLWPSGLGLGIERTAAPTLPRTRRDGLVHRRGAGPYGGKGLLGASIGDKGQRGRADNCNHWPVSLELRSSQIFDLDGEFRHPEPSRAALIRCRARLCIADFPGQSKIWRQAASGMTVNCQRA